MSYIVVAGVVIALGDINDAAELLRSIREEAGCLDSGLFYGDGLLESAGQMISNGSEKMQGSRFSESNPCPIQ